MKLKIEEREVGGHPLLLVPDPRLEIVRFVLVAEQGASEHGSSKVGLTRAVLEAAFRGSERRGRHALNEALERIGSRVSVFSNSELSGVSGTCLARHLTTTLSIIQEALFTPAFAEDERSLLHDELREKLRAERDDDSTLAAMYLRQSLAAKSRFEYWNSGYEKDLEHWTRSDYIECHHSLIAQRWWFSFAGDFDADEVASALDMWPTAQEDHDKKLPAFQKSVEGGWNVTLIDKEDRQSSYTTVSTWGLPPQHDDAFSLLVGTVAFGGTFTSPLCHTIREQRGWSYVAYANMTQRALLDTRWSTVTVPQQKHAVESLLLQKQMLQELAEVGISKELFEHTREYLLNQHPFDVANAFDLMSPALYKKRAGLPLDSLFTFEERLLEESPDRVNAVLRQFLSKVDWHVAMVGEKEVLERQLRETFSEGKLKVVHHRA